MRTLVTGGAGFIGSNLVDRLLDEGHDVALLDDFSSGKEVNIAAALAAGVKVHRADIRNPLEVDDVFAQVKPEAVFHLAAQIDVRKSVDDPAFDARTNVEGTINVLNGVRAVEGRVINVSTGGAIYGDTELIPTPETVEPLPEAPYGQSKFCAERYLGLFTRLYGTPAASVRLGNVYGPRQDPLGEAGVVAIFCGRLERGERPVIYGDGRQTRDYVFVSDVVAALLAVLARPGANGEYNVGTGRESSVLDIVDGLRPLTETNFEPEFAEARPGELERSCLDVTRAREELGWTAEVELHDGLRRTMEWARCK
jgi:UDP-glucose 4-epimerase